MMDMRHATTHATHNDGYSSKSAQLEGGLLDKMVPSQKRAGRVGSHWQVIDAETAICSILLQHTRSTAC